MSYDICQSLEIFHLADIEQLTHKTGNFKEFNIFCSMLESGLNKVCVIFITPEFFIPALDSLMILRRRVIQMFLYQMERNQIVNF